MEIFLMLAALGAVGALAFGGGGSDDTEDDVVYGTDNADYIDTGMGDDYVESYDGDDEIHLGEGDDYADAGAGNDTVFGDRGSDLIYGGAGDDIVYGDEGDDILVDDLGIDFLDGGDGNDIVYAVDAPGSAGPDADKAFGGQGFDYVVGDNGDVMYGGPDADAFAVYSDESGDQPVTIGDYDPVNEVLYLDFDSAAFPAYTEADITTNVVGGDLELLVAGKVVAVLQGTTTYDPANVVVTMV